MSFDIYARVDVIGGGLAGCEAAYQLARRGLGVNLYEMKPHRYSEAHESPGLGELVCSNSFKSQGLGQASGLLQEEMAMFGSLIIEGARANRVPAGQALAVNREHFSRWLTEKIENHPKIDLVRAERDYVDPERYTIVATGPLTSAPMAACLEGLARDGGLYFYDAMAPIVDGDSVDRSVAFAASRYDKGEPDYLNCPMNKEEFERFFEALMTAETVPTRDFEEEKVFQGCQPLEVLAAKGPKTLLFGPMKPVGLTDPRTGRWPHAAVQLRREDVDGQRYNLVGFQTKLTYPEQERIFRMIPGLENCVFHRKGSLHRNTYLEGPKLLDPYLRLRRHPMVQLAGQLTGVEGYLESAAMGLWVGVNLAMRLKGFTPDPLPKVTPIGALAGYVCGDVGGGSKKFEPMNMNFGLLSPLGERIRDKKRVKEIKAVRAIEGARDWLDRFDQ